MEVSVRYQIASKNTITDLSYNRSNDLLTTTADGTDTAALFTVDPDTLQLYSKFTNNETKPPALSCLSWSNNGKLLALGRHKIQIWKLDEGRFVPYHVFNQGFIDIQNIAWAPDDATYLCNGIVSKDLQLSINIRNIETKQLRQIIVDDVIIAANFDPFGKYIVVLTLKNRLQLYDVKNLKKHKTISMAYNQKTDIPTLKQHRTINWSPDYSYIAVPNLNDSKISSTVIFDRNKDFKIKEILVGHQSPISCVKFSPEFYEYSPKNQPCFLLAMGDTSGCLSIWRIGKQDHSNNININQQTGSTYNKPLFLVSTPQQAFQSIQNIVWNKSGNQIFVNVLKRYLICISLKLDFTKQNQLQMSRILTQKQKTSMILGIYGATADNQITGRKLEIYGLDSFAENTGRLQQQKQLNQSYKLSKDSIESKFNEMSLNKGPMVKTKQEVIIKPGEKKRIIPSMMKPQSTVLNLQNKASCESEQANSLNLTHRNSFMYRAPLPIVRLPILTCKLKRIYYLSKNTQLQLTMVNGTRILTLTKSRDGYNNDDTNQLQYQCRRVFKSEITYLQIIESNLNHNNNHSKIIKKVLVIHQRRLYIFDDMLQIQQLPIYLGDIAMLATNQQGHIYYLLTNGMMRAFDYPKKKFIMQTSIAYLLLEQTEQKEKVQNTQNKNQTKIIDKNPFSQFYIDQQNQRAITVLIKESNQQYFYSINTHSWVKLQFEQGMFKQGHSLRILPVQKFNTEHFYKSYLKQKQFGQFVGIYTKQLIGFYQLQCCYYKNNNFENKYKQALVKMLTELKNRGSDSLLRNKILNLLFDPSSSDYISSNNQREDLWNKIRKIGGRIIQQFTLLGSTTLQKQ